jgi:hypothetical protein
MSDARLGSAMSLLVGAAVHAGPVWCESIDGGADAGPLPGSAQVPMGGGPLFKIDGKLAGASPAAPDFEDMYLIYVVDPLGFVASTSPLDGGGAEFDTQLWLFRVDPSDCTSARGLLANDDIADGKSFSRILPLASDGSGAALLVPGFYYIAISGAPGDDPLSANGLIFDQLDPTEISGPDGLGGGDPIIGWQGGAPPHVGLYTIAFAEGAVEFPNVCCPADLDRDGMVGFGDLLTTLSSWGDCHGCVADVDQDGEVGFGDLLAVLATWGPCR